MPNRSTWVPKLWCMDRLVDQWDKLRKSVIALIKMVCCNFDDHSSHNCIVELQWWSSTWSYWVVPVLQQNKSNSIAHYRYKQKTIPLALLPILFFPLPHLLSLASPPACLHNPHHSLTLATTLDLANYFTFCFIILKNHIKRGNVFLVFVELMMKRPEEAVCHAFSIRLDPFEAVAAAALLDEDINK